MNDVIINIIKELEALREEIVPAIEGLEQDLVNANVTIRAADAMLKAVSRMKIDGWLDEEYDLPDQKELIEAAKDYAKLRGDGKYISFILEIFG